MNLSKLLIVIPSLTNGGAERVASGMANYFVRQGVKVSLLLYVDTDRFYPIDDNVQVFQVDRVNFEHPVKVRRMWNKIRGFLHRILATREAADRLRPDVILTFLPAPTVLTILACLGSGIPVIGQERNNPQILPFEKHWRIARWLTAFLAQGYVFQTERAKNFFPDRVQRKGIVIPNPLSNPDINQCKPSEARKIISSMGRLVQQKGFDLLISAFAKISPKYPGYQLVIYGEGPERKPLEQLIEALGLSDQVFLPGNRLDALVQIKDTAIFVLPSRYEGFPNALLEAMAIGMPCIASDCFAGPAELIHSGVNGLLVSVEDEHQLARAMAELLDKPELRAQFAAESIKVRDDYHESRIYARYETYFAQIQSQYVHRQH